MDTSANFKIYMCKTVGSNPFFFFRKGTGFPPDASYNDPILGIYVIVIRMINKDTFFQLQLYTKQVMYFIIIIIIIII